MADVFEQYGVFRWVVGSFDIPLPVQKLDQKKRNRLVPHKRIYRKGARHDNTGPDPDVWDMSFLAHNDSTEPGIPSDYYPRVVLELEQSFELNETGTLYTTRGPRRCVFSELTIAEDRTAGVDAAAVSCVWNEDNEDDVTAASFQAPSARSVATLQLSDSLTNLNLNGMGGGNFLDSLRQSVASLVALAEAPGTAVAEIERQMRVIADCVDQTEDAYGSALGSANDEQIALLTDPTSATPALMMRTLADTCARAAFEQANASNTTAIVVRRYSATRSIFEIALELDQDPYDLLGLNDSLPNPHVILAGTPVRVFA